MMTSIGLVRLAQRVPTLSVLPACAQHVHLNLQRCCMLSGSSQLSESLVRRHYPSACRPQRWLSYTGRIQKDSPAEHAEGTLKRENIYTVPNALTFGRMLATPVLGYLVACEYYTAALSAFILAGLSDWADGAIARKWPSQRTAMGSIMDPYADKLLIGTLSITLAYVGIIPVPLMSLIVVRDVCLMGAGFYIRYKTVPPPVTLSKYVDMSIVTVSVDPTFISKINTALQLFLISASLGAPLFDMVDSLPLQILWYSVGVTTVWSGVSYLFTKDALSYTKQWKKNNW